MPIRQTQKGNRNYNNGEGEESKSRDTIAISPRKITGIFSEIARRLARKIRYHSNFPILYQYKDFTIKLPAKHSLPEFQKRYLNYDRFLPLLAKYASPLDTVVDIGANVGDTLAGMVEQNPNTHYICIEPDESFYRHLTENVERMKSSMKGLQIQTINAFVGKNISNISLDGKDGTKHAIISKGGKIKSVPLDQIISNQSNTSVPTFHNESAVNN